MDMARHEGREAATPVIMGEQVDPPKYGELCSEAASQVFPTESTMSALNSQTLKALCDASS